MKLKQVLGQPNWDNPQDELDYIQHRFDFIKKYPISVKDFADRLVEHGRALPIRSPEFPTRLQISVRANKTSFAMHPMELFFPETDQGKKDFKRLEKMAQQSKSYELNELPALAKQYRTAEKRLATLAYKTKEIQAVEQLPSEYVPKQLPFGIENPYWAFDPREHVQKYAGNIDGFDWFKHAKDYIYPLYLLRKALERNHLGDLTWMYAAIKEDNDLLFATIGADNLVVFENMSEESHNTAKGKRDEAYIHFRSVYKITGSRFAHMSTAEQDHLIHRYITAFLNQKRARAQAMQDDAV